jgi:N-acetylglutamate synthase-like GNAT family acetyltransferase
MFTLRPAVEEDLTAIRTLVKEGRINPTGLKWSRFVVAVSSEGDIVGCGQVKPHHDGSCELASLVVTAEWRGRGVAKAIIEYLVNAYSEDLYLMCRSSLGAFYKRFGFRALQATEMPAYFRRISRLASLMEVLRKEGETLLVMKRGAEDIHHREHGEHRDN